MGVRDLSVLINSRPPMFQKEKERKIRKQMGAKNQPIRLACSGQGFRAQKNRDDLGHELI